MLPTSQSRDEPECPALLCRLGQPGHIDDPVLDRITRTAARLFAVPVAMVQLIHGDRRWSLSRSGADWQEAMEGLPFCTHTIGQDEPMVVGDAAGDIRFHDHALVTGPPYIRFYAGRSLRSRRGDILGTLCVIDRAPRESGDVDRAALGDLADMVQDHLWSLEAAEKTHAMQVSLERSETLLSRTASHAAVGIAVASTDGRWLEMNQRFCDILGHSRDELLGAHVADFAHPDDRERGLAMARQVLQGDTEALDMELRFLRADGSCSWTQVGASVLRDREGHPENLVVVLTDIHVRKTVEHDLATLRHALEQRVAERTAELHLTVVRLQGEIAARASTQQALIEEKERFETTLQLASDAFVEVDADDRIVSWNRSAELIFGWSRDEAIGRSLADTIVPASMRERHLKAFESFMAGLPDTGHLVGRHLELSGVRRDGEEFPLELTLGATRIGGRMVANAFLQDISRRKADELALRSSAERLRTITDNAPAMIAYIDRDLRYRFHNRAYTDWFDIAPDGLLGIRVPEFWGEATCAQLQPVIERVLAGHRATAEYSLPGRTGPMWFYATLVPHVVEDGTVAGFYLLAQDVTERKLLYERIEHEASHDALTGLPNRRALMQRLQQAMNRVRRHDRAVAVLFMDLDNFKPMNDTLGHEFGDAVLRHFGETIRGSVRDSDFVARLAGDEFVVVIEDLEPVRDHAERLGRALLARLATEREIQGVAVRLAASVGVAVHDGQDEETPQELLRRADAAMYRAKAAGRQRLAF
nr:PAS domain S-box protein [Dyella lutea]